MAYDYDKKRDSEDEEGVSPDAVEELIDGEEDDEEDDPLMSDNAEGDDKWE